MSGLADARILLGVTGGIAAYKAVLVARLLSGAGAVIDVVLTHGAQNFVGGATFEGITGRRVRSEMWDDVAGGTHVGLARAVDAVLVYPATAHLLARASAGLADDLLTTSLLAATCPIVVAPAMHAEMWEHAATQDNVARLRGRGVTVIGPAEGELMGGDVGPGRAVEPGEAVEAVAAAIARGRDLVGRTVVVTAGGTREPIDPVRFIGNRSSGRMGFAVAAVAAERGAGVHLVAAPTHLDTPAGVRRHDVVTAEDMREVVLDLAGDADVVVKAAAVADFRPARPVGAKIKKTDGPPRLDLEPTTDILAELGRDRRTPDRNGPLLVGFAAETEDAEAHGRAKLSAKDADLFVVNDVSRSDAGFEVDRNQVVILGRDGDRTEVPLAAKTEVAQRLWDEIARRLE